MFKVFTSLLSLCILCYACQATPSGNQSPKTYEDFIWLLPADTETMMVAKGPINITTAEPSNFDGFLQKVLYGGADSINKDRLTKQLAGQKLLFYVEGSRKFKTPKSLGLAPFEGCQIMTFGSEFASRREAIIQSLEKEARSVIKVDEYKVAVYEEIDEKDLWKFYIVSPKPDMLLMATDLNYLTEILKRLKTKSDKRALPDTLSEWKEVDTTAQFWAIRHYDKDNATLDPTSPLSAPQLAPDTQDSLAIGLVAMYTPGKDFAIRYLSGNGNAIRIQKNFWVSEGNQSTPEVRVLQSKAIEISYSPKKQNTGTLFYFMAAFGHAVYV